MAIKEITLEKLNPETFIKEKVQEISSIVGDNLAINALSGGVDSSTVTMLGHKALGNKLKTFFIDNGLMREGEPEEVVSYFKNLGVNVELIDAKEVFFKRLKGIKDPEEKREAITQAFYKDVFGPLVRKTGAKYLLQGTNYTDIEETVAGIKRQHNILEQLGIDPEKEYGYQVIEPLIQLRKSGVRKIAQALGLPEKIYNRIPFPGPALAARIIGEVTPEKAEIVRKASYIIEEELKNAGLYNKVWMAFAVLLPIKTVGIQGDARSYKYPVVVRIIESKDAMTANFAKIPYNILEKISTRITNEITEVNRVVYDISNKPPATMEWE